MKSPKLDISVICHGVWAETRFIHFDLLWAGMFLQILPNRSGLIPIGYCLLLGSGCKLTRMVSCLGHSQLQRWSANSRSGFGYQFQQTIK